MIGKLQKFAAIREFPNVLEFTEYPDPEKFPYLSRWSREFFKNDHPLVLELACGKGEYTLALSRKYPRINFVGVDIKGNRIWKGAKTALEEQIPNAAFLRIEIEKLGAYFGPGEVSEFWITFPDPYLKPSKAKKRLTSSRFIRVYRKVLKPGGLVHLKTDSPELYAFTLEVIEEEKCTLLQHMPDLYAGEIPDEILSVTTFYEKQHLAAGKKIKYIKFSL